DLRRGQPDRVQLRGGRPNDVRIRRKRQPADCQEPGRHPRHDDVELREPAVAVQSAGEHDVSRRDDGLQRRQPARAETELSVPTTTNYIWDEQNYLAEADGTNTINVVYTNEPERYGNLVSTRLPVAGTPTTVYHHFDAIGSTRQLTNAAVTVIDTMIY